MLKEGLIRRLESLVRDKLAKGKHVKDMGSFNEQFQKITREEQIDRYSKGLKPFVSRELWTKEYSARIYLMRDAERFEARFRRSGDCARPSRPIESVPMDIANLTLAKLLGAERNMCRKQGRCF